MLLPNRVQKLARAARANQVRKARAALIGKRQLSEAVTRTSAVQDHLREVLVPDEFYSLPRSLAVFHGLTDALGPLRRQSGPPVRARRALTADVHETAVVPRSDADDRMFFQVIRTRPAKGKHVYGSPATSSWLEKGDIAVTFHESCLVDGQWMVNSRPLIEAGSFSSVAILRLRPEHVHSLEASLLCHERMRRLVFSMFNIHTQLVQDLVASAAWPKSPHHFQVQAGDNRTEEIIALESKGLLRNCGDDGSFSKWKFTEFGSAAVQARELASPPQVLLRRKRAVLELQDASRYELMLMLEEQGFQWKNAPKESAARFALSPFTSSSTEKVWYCTGVAWETQYAICLVQAHRLFT